MVDQVAFQALKASISPAKLKKVSFSRMSNGSNPEKQETDIPIKGKQLPAIVSYHQVSDEVDSNHSGELRATN